MTNDDPIDQATALLRTRLQELDQRLDEILHEREELTTQRQRIRVALQSLGSALGKGDANESQGGVVLHAGDFRIIGAGTSGFYLPAAIKGQGVIPTFAKPSAIPKRSRSVKSRVYSLLCDTPSRLTASEIVDAMADAGDPLDSSRPGPAVRNALWALRNEGLVRNDSKGHNWASLWGYDDEESAEADSSNGSLAVEGGPDERPSVVE